MKGAEERVLGDVLGLIPPDDACGDAEDRVPMALDEDLVGAELPGERALHKRQVVVHRGRAR